LSGSSPGCETAAAMRHPFPLRLVRLLLAASFAAAGLLPGLAAAEPRGWVAPGPRVASGPGGIRARYAVLVDPATGVLWGRRSRMAAPPASLTEMLTALAVRASLDLDAVTVASCQAARQPARRLAMKRGQELTVDQALKALMIGPPTTWR
jgi:D-alanyl-D-alanine carboxypeptidase